MTAPAELFSAIVDEYAARPFVTFYDLQSGERSELSAKSLGNWVAKTHFLLLDELGLGVGDRAYVALPAHWISIPAILGCWSAGLEIVTDSEQAASADVAFVEPLTLPEAAGAGEIYAVAPEMAARGFGNTPPVGANDYVGAVRPQADAWATVHSPATADDPALDGQSGAEVLALAQARADELEVTPQTRLLSAFGWRDAADWLDALLVPLVVGGSIVLVRNGNPEDAARIAQQERARILD